MGWSHSLEPMGNICHPEVNPLEPLRVTDEDGVTWINRVVVEQSHAERLKKHNE